jgi:hypothetical protein
VRWQDVKVVTMLFRLLAALRARAGTSLTAVVGTLSLCLPLWAHPAPVCPAPQGRSVLQLQPPGEGRSQACDPQALERLPARDITTTLPPALGLAGEHRWTGVPLRHLVMQLGGNEHSRIVLAALNDYAVEIPWSDLVRYDPVLAYRRDGQRMGIRDKGPLILIYPFDAHPDLQQGQDYVNRTIWQVHAVSVR